MASTLLSNRAMCHLKSAELQSQNLKSNNNDTMQLSLTNCIDDCTSALEQLDAIMSTETTSEKDHLSRRGKILYRRSIALVVLATSVRNNPNNTHNDNNNNNNNNNDDDDAKE